MGLLDAAPEDLQGSELSAWTLASQYRFNEARSEFRRLEKSEDEEMRRRAKYGHAIALLNAIPKSVGKIEKAEQLLHELSDRAGNDPITIRSVYHLGRIKELHQRDPDRPAAAEYYWRMIREWPEDPFTQIAIVKLVTMQIYEPTSREEKLRRYAELELLHRFLTLPSARRDYNYILGVACLSLEISKEKALNHLLECVDAGIKSPRMRLNTYCRIGVTAKQLGQFELAREYFNRFLDKAPRDLRTRMVRDHLEELSALSVSNSEQKEIL
jgi:tetratricopeptide (TPR) repeat protein